MRLDYKKPFADTVGAFCELNLSYSDTLLDKVSNGDDDHAYLEINLLFLADEFFHFSPL